jgi:hypothetical protein
VVVADTVHHARECVYAQNTSGQYEQALPLDDAIELAGGIKALADAMVGETHWYGYLSNAPDFQENTVQALGLPAYLLSPRTFDLLQIALPEKGSLYYNFGRRGWVFFPKGDYTKIRLDIIQAGGSFTVSRATVVKSLELPWTETFGPSTPTNVPDAVPHPAPEHKK